MSWEPLNLAAEEFAEKPSPPAIAGLIYTGGRHVISGAPESAKTLFAFIVALEHIRAGGKVALIDFEMGATATRSLLVDLGATLDEIAGVYYVEPDGPPTVNDIDKMIKFGVTLTVIDAAAGAYDVSGLDDNKRGDAERFARVWIRPLWDRGVTTLLVDHVTKNIETRGKYAIGSERKVGQAEVHLGLEVVKPLHRGADGLLRVRTHKDRRGFLPRPIAAELELHSDPETHAITWTFRPASEGDSGDGFRPTVLMQRVYEYVKSNDSVSRNTVEKNVKGRSTDWKRKAIDVLVSEGYLNETLGPRGARILTPLRPFNGTSPDLASPRPAKTTTTSPTSPAPYKGGEVVGEDEVDDGGEVDAGEVERLAELAREAAS